MPYPPQYAYQDSNPETELEPQINAISGGTGNAHTIPSTANGLTGFAMDPYDVPAVAFSHTMVRSVDGTAYLHSVAAPPMGFIAAKYACFAFKIKPQSIGTIQNILYFGAANRRISLQVGGTIQYSMTLGGNTTLALNGTTVLVAGQTYIVHISVVADAVAGYGQMWINGQPEVGPVAMSVHAAECDFTLLTQMSIGATNIGGAPLLTNSELGFVYVDMGADPAQSVPDPESFCTPGGLDVDTGLDGSLPSGIQPKVFLGRRVFTFWNVGNNYGAAGGAFTKEGTAFAAGL